MTQNILKQKVAEAALEHVKGVRVLGVGTGSTVNFMIDMLSDFKSQIDAAVSSSEGSTIRLKKAGIHVIDLNEAGELELYVDGADEINAQLQMVKGGGGALTREKIIGAASKRFLCIADETKYVDVLGKFPLPVEVIPMARSYVAREMVKMGGQPVWREGFVSDNHCHILDVHNLEILNPTEMENVINDIPGVVTCGIFALRAANVALLGSVDGIRTLS